MPAGALPAYNSVGTVFSSATLAGTNSVPVPTHNAGDLLVLHVLVRNGNNDGTLTAINTAGWTLLGGAFGGVQNPRIGVGWKIGNGSETTVSITATGGASGDRIHAWVYRFTAADGFAATPIANVGTALTGSSLSLSMPTVNPAGATNRLAVALFGSSINATTTSAATGATGGTWTKPVADSPSVGGGIGIQIASVASGGAISGGAAVISGTTPWVNLGFTLVPADVGGAAVTITTTLEAVALRQGLLATTSLIASGQTRFATAATLDADAQGRLLSTATLDAAARKALTATATLEAAAQRSFTITGSLEAAGLKSFVITAQLDAVAALIRAVTATFNAVAQGRISATATLDAVAATLVLRTITAALDAAAQAPRSATATLDAVTSLTRTITAQLDAVAEKRLTITAALDVISKATLTTSTTLEALAQRQGWLATASLEAASQRSGLTATTTLEAAGALAGAGVMPSVLSAGAAVALGGTGSQNTDLQPALPPQSYADCTLICQVVVGGTPTVSCATPAGWTLVAADVHSGGGFGQWIFAAPHGTAAPVVNWNAPDGTNTRAMARVYSVLNTSSAPGDLVLGNLTQGTSTTLTQAALTSTVTNTLALVFNGVGNDAGLTEATGETGGEWLSEYTGLTTLGNDAAIQLSSAPLAAPGTITGGTQAILSAAWMSRSIAVLPMVAGAEQVYTVNTSPRPQVLYDLDIDSDIDDVVDLIFMLNLEQLGELDIVAAVVTSAQVHAAPTMKAIINYYGRTGLLIGANTASQGATSNLYCTQTQAAFPVSGFATAADFPAALTVLRQTLAAAADDSIEYLSTGSLDSVKLLLESPADGISALTGVQLVAAKVRTFFCVAGAWPSGAGISDFGGTGPRAVVSDAVLDLWPTSVPIIFTNLPEVDATLTGENVMVGLAAGNPARFSWTTFFGNANASNTRAAWAQVSILGLARGIYPNSLGTDWQRLLGRKGSPTVNTTTGVTDWTFDDASNRSWLRRMQPAATFVTTINALIGEPAFVGTAAATLDAAAQKRNEAQATLNAVAAIVANIQATLNAVAQKTLTSTATLDAVAEAVAVEGQITAAMDALAQARLTLTASLVAAGQTRFQAQSTLNAVSSATLSAGASLAAAGRATRSQTVTLEALAQSTRNVSASLEAFAIAIIANQVSAALEAAGQRTFAASSVLEAVAQIRRTQTASLQAVGQAPRIVASALDALAALVGATQVNAALDAAGRKVGIAATATFEARAVLFKTIASNLDAVAQIARTIGTTFDASARASRNVTTALHAAGQRAFLIQTSIDAVAARVGLETVSLDVLALRQSILVSATFDAITGELKAPSRRQIQVPAMARSQIQVPSMPGQVSVPSHGRDRVLVRVPTPTTH